MLKNTQLRSYLPTLRTVPELQYTLDRFSSVTYKDTTNTEVNFNVEVLLRGHRDQSVADKVRTRFSFFHKGCGMNILSSTGFVPLLSAWVIVNIYIIMLLRPGWFKGKCGPGREGHSVLPLGMRSSR